MIVIALSWLALAQGCPQYPICTAQWVQWGGEEAHLVHPGYVYQGEIPSCRKTIYDSKCHGIMIPIECPPVCRAYDRTGVRECYTEERGVYLEKRATP